MKKVTAFLMVFVFLVGCNTSGETLRVGEYTDEDVTTFRKSEIKDQETIKKVHKYLNTKDAIEATPQNQPPNLVIQINNKKKSTLVRNVYLWIDDPTNITFIRGFLDDTEKNYYKLAEEDWNTIKDLLEL